MNGMITYEYRDDRYIVHKWGVYPEWSVLAGQDKKQFLDSFETEEEVLENYPNATLSHAMLQPGIYFGHLEGDE